MAERKLPFGLGRFLINILAIFFPTRIIAVSESVKKSFYTFVRKKVIVIYNGIDTQLFKPKESLVYTELKSKLGIPQKSLVVGIISRLVPWKGHLIFLKAAKILFYHFSNVHFIIVGDTTFGKEKYLKQLKNITYKLGIQDRTTFVGFKEQIEEILGVIDILVHCSVRPEPFGLAIVEAMALGKVVIATDIGATREIIDENKDGILVKPANPYLLAEVITKLVNRPEKIRELERAARKKVEENFNATGYLHQIENLYSSILNIPSLCL